MLSFSSSSTGRQDGFRLPDVNVKSDQLQCFLQCFLYYFLWQRRYRSILYALVKDAQIMNQINLVSS